MSVKSIGIVVLFFILCVFMAVMTADPWYDIFNSTFLLSNNIENLLRRTAMYGILGIGVCFVIITSGIDLSIGSIVCLAGCLLAMFLRVDYRAFDSRDVVQLSTANSTIAVRGDSTVFKPGDQVRFSGGRRARNAILTVTRVESASLESARGKELGGLITVAGELSRDDDGGSLAPLLAVTEFDSPRSGTTSSVTVAGDHPRLAARDQVVLVHPSLGMKQATVLSSRLESGATKLELSEPLDANFSGDWSLIPLERRQPMPAGVAVLAVLGISLLLGAIHGLLITRVRLQPFVVTLCGLLIYRGLSRWLVNDQPVGFGTEFDTSLRLLGNGKWTLYTWQENQQSATFGIPYPFFLLLAVAMLAGVLLNYTIWGRYLLALGRNEEAARYSGINTGRMTLLAYMICTMLAAVGGMLFALDSNSVSPASFGNFFELYAIAAAVLGGCSLRGGEGTIVGVIAGTAVMQTLNNLIVLMKISDELEFAIIGLVILLGVVADEVVRRIANRRRVSHVG